MKRTHEKTVIVIVLLLGCAPAATVTLALDEERLAGSLVAVFPVQNLSGAPAPIAELEEQLRHHLRLTGVRLLSGSALEGFMGRHRVRYVGGLSESLARALAAETGTRAVLITSLDMYNEVEPPRFGLISRLVSTGNEVTILWMDDVQFAGHQKPGLLGTGLVSNVEVLRDRALSQLAESVSVHLSGEGRGRRSKIGGKRRFKPRRFYGKPFAPPQNGRPMRVAVLPFANESPSPRGGEILALHFVRQLARLERLHVIEPGLVRQALLQGRLIREGGVSLPQADLLRAMLDADIVLSGSVREYQENRSAWGVPFVAFSARAIDTRRRQSAWTSFSFNSGDQGVVFFDAGRLHTAHALASEMVRSVVQTADRRSRKKR